MTINFSNAEIDLQSEGFDFHVASSNEQDGIFNVLEYVLANENSFPWGKLIDWGIVEKNNEVFSLASFLSKPSLSETVNNVLFRKRDDSNQFLIDLWLKKVDQIAMNKIFEQKFEKFDKSKVNKSFLTEVAKLSQSVENLSTITDYLAKFGIVLVISKPPKGIKTDAVVYLSPNGIPIIGMTLRLARLDYFWFTLLHELSHVILHYSSLDTPIVDEIDINSKVQVEAQANRLAKDSIIPRHLWERCEPRFNPINKVVVEFANSINIHPALVAGLLQYEFNAWDILRDIVDEVDVRELIDYS